MEELNQKRRFKYFMAIGQHKTYSKVAVVDEEGAFIEEEKLNHFDRQSMYDYFKS
ncbi:MAG: hypothetical protein NC818_01435 [Candidatus Omnitrophica bacterium]|nr:hypothetical protein [Candidatus Omnitrophota bacterium]